MCDVKKLSELYNINDDRLIKAIKINSKEVLPGDIFVCTMGVTADRHDFIDEAIKNGASAIVVSRDVGKKSVPVIKVDDTNLELRKLSAKFYDYPCDSLYMIGVTGTNGKTTVAEIIYQLLGENAAYLGTNGKKYKDKHVSIRNTCPDVDRLYMYFREFLDKLLIVPNVNKVFLREMRSVSKAASVYIKFSIAVLFMDMRYGRECVTVSYPHTFYIYEMQQFKHSTLFMCNSIDDIVLLRKFTLVSPVFHRHTIKLFHYPFDDFIKSSCG